MTRFNSSAKKRREKALAQKQNSVRTNSPDGRDQKTDGGLEPEGGENSFPPTQPAATAASPQPPADNTLLKDPQPPIARPDEDPHNKKKETVPISQGTALTTPKHDTQQQSEVTFHLQPAASVSNSRRQRSRTAKNTGRTSRALSRDEQRMFLWEEEQYQRLFNSSRSGADPIAKIGLTLASGQRVKPGESLTPDLIDSPL